MSARPSSLHAPQTRLHVRWLSAQRRIAPRHCQSPLVSVTLFTAPRTHSVCLHFSPSPPCPRESPHPRVAVFSLLAGRATSAPNCRRAKYVPLFTPPALSLFALRACPASRASEFRSQNSPSVEYFFPSPTAYLAVLAFTRFRGNMKRELNDALAWYASHCVQTRLDHITNSIS